MDRVGCLIEELGVLSASMGSNTSKSVDLRNAETIYIYEYNMTYLLIYWLLLSSTQPQEHLIAGGGRRDTVVNLQPLTTYNKHTQLGRESLLPDLSPRDRQAIHDDLPAPIGSRHLTRPRRTLPQHPATCYKKQVASRPAYRVYELRPVLSMRTEESTGEENTTLGATVRVGYTDHMTCAEKGRRARE